MERITEPGSECMEARLLPRAFRRLGFDNPSPTQAARLAAIKPAEPGRFNFFEYLIAIATVATPKPVDRKHLHEERVKLHQPEHLLDEALQQAMHFSMFHGEEDNEVDMGAYLALLEEVRNESPLALSGVSSNILRLTMSPRAHQLFFCEPHAN